MRTLEEVQGEIREKRKLASEVLKSKLVDRDGMKMVQCSDSDLEQHNARLAELATLEDERESILSSALKSVRADADAALAELAAIKAKGPELAQPAELFRYGGLGDLFMDLPAIKGRRSDGSGWPVTEANYEVPGVSAAGLLLGMGVPIGDKTGPMKGVLREVEQKLHELGVKTTMTTSAGWAPETFRTGRLELTPERALRASDLPMVTETNQAAVVYMEETTKTNNAAEANENAALAESALALTEQTSTVRKIGTTLPVTREQLDDEPRVQGYINARLGRLVLERLDSQILVGDGAAPNLRGMVNVAGVNTQARGTDPIFDCLLKGITKIEETVGFTHADAIVLHPNDAQDLLLSRTVDGLYIYGHPAATDPANLRVWGKRLVQSSAMTENSGVAAAWRETIELAFRTGVEFEITNSHASEFTSDVRRVKAIIRAALIAYRPEAITVYSGL